MNETEGLQITAETAAGVTRVLVRGAMNVGHARQFHDFFGQASDMSTDMAIDLDAVDAVDVSGIQVLLALQMALQRRGRAMWLQRPPEVVKVALQRAGLQGTLSVRDVEHGSKADETAEAEADLPSDAKVDEGADVKDEPEADVNENMTEALRE